MKDDYEPLIKSEEDWGFIGGGSSNISGDDQGLDYLGNGFTGA